MKKSFVTVLIIIVLLIVWTAIQPNRDTTYNTDAMEDIEVTSVYSNGKVITTVKAENPKNISSIEFRYRTFFLDQYINVEPRVIAFTYPNYEENHIFELYDYSFQGQKDDLEVEVIFNYDDERQQMTQKVILQDVKRKLHDDFVITPEKLDNEVFYHMEGLTVAINEDDYNDEIVFYSNLNAENPIISVGFQKEYALYPVRAFGVISKEEALSMDFEGISPVDFVAEGNQSNIVVEYGMFELNWDGFYPYDLDGNEIFYEGKIGEKELNLYKDNQIVEVSQSSYKKYEQMVNKLPDMKFILSSGKVD